MITLYQFATSPFSEKIRRALAFKRIDYQLHEVERAAVPTGTYKNISPTGKFPAIVLDGKSVWDSTDILDQLDLAFPAHPLMPSDRREQGLAHAIEDWADESLYFYEMTIRLAWTHNLDAALDGFSASMPGIPKDQLRETILKSANALVTTQGLGRKPVAQIVADVERHFQAIDQMLDGRDWLAGSSLSRADLAVIAQLNALLFAIEGRNALDRTHNVKGWVARVDAAAPATSKS